jgi:hypothetical protein
MHRWKSQKQLERILLTLGIALIGCASPQERASQNAVDNGLVCAHFGKAGYLRQFPDATWGSESMPMVTIRTRTGKSMDIGADSIQDPLTITTDDQLDRFLIQYHNICSDGLPPSFDSMPYVLDKKRRAEAEAAEASRLEREAQLAAKAATQKPKIKIEEDGQRSVRVTEQDRIAAERKEEEARRQQQEAERRGREEAERAAKEKDERVKADALQRLSAVTLARRQTVASTPLLAGAFRLNGMLNEITANRFSRPAYADRLQNQVNVEAKSLFQPGLPLELNSWCAVSRGAGLTILSSACFPGHLEYSPLMADGDRTTQAMLEQIELIPHGKVFDVRVQLTNVCFYSCTSSRMDGADVVLYVKVLSIANIRDAPPEWPGSAN